MMTRGVSAAQARKIAKSFGVRLPSVGYEMSLGGRRWIRSTGHADFGWFESTARQPFEIVCACDETLRRGEPRGCTADCPNFTAPGAS